MRAAGAGGARRRGPGRAHPDPGQCPPELGALGAGSGSRTATCPQPAGAPPRRAALRSVCRAAGSPSDLSEVGPRPLRPLPCAPCAGEDAEEEARADPAEPRSGWIRRERDQLCGVSAAGAGCGPARAGRCPRGAVLRARPAPHAPARLPPAPRAGLPGTPGRGCSPCPPRSEGMLPSAVNKLLSHRRGKKKLVKK